jgi:hypothetical protein
MPSAPRIKSRPTPRTPRLALPILPNRHLHPASPAQNRPRIPLPPPPNRNSMPRQRLMTILASPVHPATSHLDRHNIHRRPPMRTPRLRIHLDSPNLWTLFSWNGVPLLYRWWKPRTSSPGKRRLQARERKATNSRASALVPALASELQFTLTKEAPRIAFGGRSFSSDIKQQH